MRAILPTTDIAAIPATPGLRARPARGVPLGSFAELSRQKIVFDLQLADLPVQNIDLRLVGGALRHAPALENAGGAIQQLLLPAIDLVRMNPEMTRQLGHRPVAFHRRQRYLRLERRVVPLPCLLHVLLPRYQRSLGAGLHLSQLSHFRGPAQGADPEDEEADKIARKAASTHLQNELKDKEIIARFSEETLWRLDNHLNDEEFI